MNKRTKVMMMGLVAVVAAASVAFVVFAQTDSESTASPHRSMLARVAANLGVPVDELAAAFAQARLEMIDEAVAAGRITEEQAQAMKARIEARGALRDVFAEALAAGKITQDQLALLRGRGEGMMGRDRAMPRGRGVPGRMTDRECSCR